MKISRWAAPLSVAVYAPGDDYDKTLSIILFLRNCHQQSSIVKRFATFHIFFESNFFPLNFKMNFSKTESDFVCPKSDPSFNVSQESSFKSSHNLTYSVNMARNLAREAALTHFVLPSDIELYPNLNFVESFFEMVLKYSDQVLKEKK